MKLSFLIMLFSLGVLAMTTTVQAEVKTEAIVYEHQGAKLEGFLAYDSRVKERRPGVLLVHEWWGHNDYIRERAKQFASLGYVAFAVDMYGAGKVTADPKQASAWSKPFYDDRDFFRSRLQAGLQQLTQQPGVEKSKVAALGYCFGGTAALELARSGADLASVISFHGGLGTPKPATAGTMRAQVLVLNGADDPMVKPEERAQFMVEMRAAGVQWEFVEFGGAVHAFTNKAADSYGIPGVAFNAIAERRSWERSKAFLAETLEGQTAGGAG